MRELRAHGFAVELPTGWEGAIFRRPAGPTERTHPIVHLATLPLPADRGDFGSGVVERMRAGDLFVTVFDHGEGSAGRPLFARRGLPVPLRPRDLHPSGLQRALPGQAGVQRFFTAGGRGLSLYVVIGSYPHRAQLVPRVNARLATLRVERP